MILNRIEPQLDARDQNPERGHRDRNHESAPGMNDAHDKGSAGLRRATDQWRKLEIPLFHGGKAYT